MSSLELRDRPRLNGDPAAGDPVPAAREALRAWLPAGLTPLYRYIHVRVGRDGPTADDVLQQTVFEALRHRDVPAESPGREWWLRGIARNLIRRHWRLVRRDAGTCSIETTGVQSVLEALEQAEDTAARAEALQRLLAAISSLSAEDQWLLYEFYRHGRTRAEIAARLGVTTKSVQSRLYRLRQRLRAGLGEPTGVAS